MAHLTVTWGRCRSTAVKKARLRSRASRSRQGVVTSTPAAARAAVPPPFTRGLGSRVADTTRRTPARMIASTQGGVRPTWLHGSSVT